jgi:hypothetical protein
VQIRLSFERIGYWSEAEGRQGKKGSPASACRRGLWTSFGVVSAAVPAGFGSMETFQRLHSDPEAGAVPWGHARTVWVDHQGVREVRLLNPHGRPN